MRTVQMLPASIDLFFSVMTIFSYLSLRLPSQQLVTVCRIFDCPASAGAGEGEGGGVWGPEVSSTIARA